MTQDKARILLENYLKQMTPIMRLPIYDTNFMKPYHDIIKEIKPEYVIEEYTFRDLLKIAYKLKEQDEN